MTPSEDMSIDLVQPDSSADGMKTTQEINFQDQSGMMTKIDEIIPHSEVSDYIIECEVTSENVLGKIIFLITTAKIAENKLNSLIFY